MKLGTIFTGIPIMVWAMVKIVRVGYKFARVIRKWVDLHFTPPLGLLWKIKIKSRSL